jgi:GxxExxY protein
METDYQRALELALPKHGLEFSREVEIPVAYEGVLLTTRRVDFSVTDGNDTLLLETKARREILPEDLEQCLMYLQKSNQRLCLLVNFGQFPLGIKRLLHTPSHS